MVNRMKKLILLTLIFLSMGAILMRFSSKGAEILLGIKPKSGVSVVSTPSSARVEIDGKEVGITPFENKELRPGEYLVKIDKDGSSWQGKVRLVAGTQTVVSRDLAKDIQSQAGEILILTKGKGITITTNPQGSDIEIDGKIYGKTPATFAIEEGEHTIVASHPNYLKRSIRASLPQGFNLTVSLDLALSEADLTKVSTPVIKTTPEVEVLNTPVGFLRVRDKASLAGKEITQVKPGDTLILLEELSGWMRVRLADGTEGYVSSAYVEKKTK